MSFNTPLKTSLIIREYTGQTISTIVRKTHLLFPVPPSGLHTPPSLTNMLCMWIGKFRETVQVHKAEPNFPELGVLNETFSAELNF